MPDAAGDMRHGPAERTNAAAGDGSTAKNTRRRCLKFVPEWGVSHRDREAEEMAAIVCPWQVPAEAADLLRVLLLETHSSPRA